LAAPAGGAPPPPPPAPAAAAAEDAMAAAEDAAADAAEDASAWNHEMEAAEATEAAEAAEAAEDRAGLGQVENAEANANAGDPLRWRAMPAFGSEQHDCPDAFGEPQFLPVDQLPMITNSYAAVLALLGRVYVMAGLRAALHDAHWSALYREPMTCDFVSSSSNRCRCL
jgi:hypothetical protein